MPSSAMCLFKRVVDLASGDGEFVFVAAFAAVFDAGGAARRNVGAAGVVIGLEGGNEAVMLPSVAPLIRL